MNPHTLSELREALGIGHLAVYEPATDALLRRVADGLSDDVVHDVVALVRLARRLP